jgi:hypothetical protein
MTNELKILPLLKYEVFSVDCNGTEHTDIFTGDSYVLDEDNLIFYRTGNKIRQYIKYGSTKITVTPED